jgi:hypothetical protein
VADVQPGVLLHAAVALQILRGPLQKEVHLVHGVRRVGEQHGASHPKKFPVQAEAVLLVQRVRRDKLQVQAELPPLAQQPENRGHRHLQPGPEGLHPKTGRRHDLHARHLERTQRDHQRDPDRAGEHQTPPRPNTTTILSARRQERQRRDDPLVRHQRGPAQRRRRDQHHQVQVRPADDAAAREARRTALHQDHGLRTRRPHPEDEERQVRPDHLAQTRSQHGHPQGQRQQLQPRTGQNFGQTDLQEPFGEEGALGQDRNRQEQRSVEGNRQDAVRAGQEDGQLRVTRTYQKTGRREVEAYLLTRRYSHRRLFIIIYTLLLENKKKTEWRQIFICPFGPRL